jgi:hypothetical protein
MAGVNISLVDLDQCRSPPAKFPAYRPTLSQLQDDFRQDNGLAIRKGRAQSVSLRRAIGLPTNAGVAIDGSKFNPANYREDEATFCDSAHIAARSKRRKSAASR